MCSDLIARRLGSTSCSHVYLRDGLHVPYHNALPISTLRIAAKQNRARGNLQPARAGGKHGFFPALTTTGMASTHIGVRLLAPNPFGGQQPKATSVPATPPHSFQRAGETAHTFPANFRSSGIE